MIIIDHPLAMAGLRSYRYRGPYGWIMLGASDDQAALREAQRSTQGDASAAHLQRWDGHAYVDMSGTPVILSYELYDSPRHEYEREFPGVVEAQAYLATLAQHMIVWHAITDAEGNEL